MQKNSKKKGFKKDPNITWFENLRKDPEYQRIYQEQSQLLDIAIKIAEVREKHKITQKELAKKIKSSQAVISRIERGIENMSLKKLFRIAEALNLTVKINIF